MNLGDLTGYDVRHGWLAVGMCLQVAEMSRRVRLPCHSTLMRACWGYLARQAILMKRWALRVQARNDKSGHLSRLTVIGWRG
jgi:hypothetical protein